jgi:hypothetical protein
VGYLDELGASCGWDAYLNSGTGLDIGTIESNAD